MSPVLPPTMKAVAVKAEGRQAYVGEASTPTIRPNEVLVKVKAQLSPAVEELGYLSIYRCMLHHHALYVGGRKGVYPPPPGSSEIMGLELSGMVVQVGTECRTIKEGDRVACLVSGGAHAEYCAVEEPLAMKLPDDMDMMLAGSIPEVWLTAYQLLHFVGKVQCGEKVLIHAGASGVGLAAIQLVHEVGAIPFVTASAEKHHHCLKAGAEAAIDYKKGPWEQELMDRSGGGVDLILDSVGASYYQQNISVLRPGGRLVVFGTMGGVVAELDLRALMRRNLSVLCSTLRGRPLPYKTELVKAFWTPARVEAFKAQRLLSVVDRVMEMEEIMEAHTLMENNVNAGKILIRVDPSIV